MTGQAYVCYRKTGVGKTTLMENMAIQDILSGEGVGIIDPTANLPKNALKFVPENRAKDVLSISLRTIWIGLSLSNVMENVDPTQKAFGGQRTTPECSRKFGRMFGRPEWEYILNNCILALLEYPDSTLLGINRMLSDKKYREEVVNNMSDPVVKAFWTDEFAKYSTDL